jgi:hypothetical protein
MLNTLRDTHHRRRLTAIIDLLLFLYKYTFKKYRSCILRQQRAHFASMICGNWSDGMKIDVGTEPNKQQNNNKNKHTILTQMYTSKIFVWHIRLNHSMIVNTYVCLIVGIAIHYCRCCE